MDDTALLPAADDVAPTRHRIDADAYYRMAELGILRREERVELIEGEIIDMAPIGPGHEATVMRLTRVLVRAFGDDAIVSVQNSVRLDRWSAPQPDFAILRPREDFYGTGERAGPADVLLVVEVADSSLRYDRTVKLPLYARHGVPEVWIVDVRRKLVEAHRGPGAEGYAESVTLGAGETVALAAAPEVNVRLDIG